MLYRHISTLIATGLMGILATMADTANAAGPISFFGDPVTSTIANATGRLRVVDINHDGIPEIVVGACDDASGNNLVAVYRVDAQLRARQVARENMSCPRDLLIQDFNGDGLLDTFVGAWDGQGPLSPSLLYGQTAGRFAAAVRPINYGVDHNWSGFLSVVDGDDDATPDVAMPYDNSDSEPSSWGMTVFSGVDFHQIADVSLGDTNPGAPIGAIDVNLDGHRDVVFADKTAVRTGTAWAVVSNATLGVPHLTPMSRVISFDHDGALDLLVVDAASSSMRVCLTRRGVICAESRYVSTGLMEAPRKMAIKDLNNDGIKDFVVSAGERLAFSVSRSDGTYDTSSVPTRGRQRVTGVVAADVNRDGKTDLIVSYNSELDIYPGR